jgi:hypothetical protein
MALPKQLEFSNALSCSNTRQPVRDGGKAPSGVRALFARIVGWDRRLLAVENLALPATDGARQLSSSLLELVICM